MCVKYRKYTHNENIRYNVKIPKRVVLKKSWPNKNQTIAVGLFKSISSQMNASIV